MSEIVSQINTLKHHAIEARIMGKFVISTGEVSGFWIDINRFMVPNIISSMSYILSRFISNCYKMQGSFSLVVPSSSESSEKTFPMPLIADSAIRLLENCTEIDKVLAYKNKVSGFTIESRPKDLCIVVIGVSVHISILLETIKALTSHGCKILYVFSFLCRELRTIVTLSKLGIPLVPVIIAKEDSGEVFSILEVERMDDPVFMNLRNYGHLLLGIKNESS